MTVKFSCIIDEKPKYARQALLWAASLLTYGQVPADALVVHTVDGCAPEYQRVFDSWGIRIEKVRCFDRRHAWSNKLGQLEGEALRRADHVVLCDCDLAFCGSILPWVSGNAVRAVIAARAWFPFRRWKRILAAAGLGRVTSAVPSVFGPPTLAGFCNGGLYVLPQSLFQSLRSVWPKWDRWVLDRRHLFQPWGFFADQISFAMSCQELALRVEHLPVELNYHTRWRSPRLLRAVLGKSDIFPLVLHYHRETDAQGYLLPTKIASVNARIRQINRLLRRFDRGDFNPRQQISAQPGQPVLNVR